MSDAHKESMHGRVEPKLEQISGHENPMSDSAKRLSDEMEKLLGQSPEELSLDKLDEILDRLEQEDPLPNGADAFNAEAGLHRFQKRLASQTAGEGNSSATKRFPTSLAKRTGRKSLKIILLAAAIAVLLLAGTAQAFNLFDLVAQWTSELFSFSTKTVVEEARISYEPLDQGEERFYDSVEDMMADFGITAPLFPTWVPERFKMESAYARNAVAGVRLYVDYRSEDRSLHFRACEIEQNNLRSTEIDTNGALKFRLNGSDFYLMTDTNTCKIAWQNGVFECRITGNVSQEEMLEMINSIS